MAAFKLPDEPSEKTMVEMDMRYLEHLRAESYKQGQRDALEAASSIVENADTPDCGGWSALGIAVEIRKLMEGI